MDEAGGIGKDGRLPWRLSADLRRFKALTLGHCVIMGRKTWETIGKPLPGRTNLVISRQAGFRPDGVVVQPSLEAALEYASNKGETEAFVIGGGQVFKQALPLADRIYLTRVHARLDCDTFFPQVDWSDYRMLSGEEVGIDAKNEYRTNFTVYQR